MSLTGWHLVRVKGHHMRCGMMLDIFLGKRIAHLQTWGCKAYAFVPKVLRKKLGNKARVCALIGYSSVTKGYQLLDIKSGDIFVAVSVAFDETRFPLTSFPFSTTDMCRTRQF